MHTTLPTRRRVLRLAAVAFAAGLVMSVAPLPNWSFVPVASATVEPLGRLRPMSPVAVAALADEVAEAAADVPRVSALEERTDSFRMIGVALEEEPDEPVLVRVLDEDGTWGEWNELEIDADKGPDPGTPEARAAAEAAGRVVSEPLWVGEARGYEISLAGDDADGAEVALVREEVRRTLTDAVPLAEAALPAPFGINSRASWGARAPKDTPSIARDGLKLAVVHHTAGTNNYSAAQVPSIIRSMQAFHMDTNGWSDLGYNFVVDKFGGIWEGRAGGTANAVVGAHAAGFNTGSVGVSVMGNYSGQYASSAALEAVSRVVGYRLQEYGAHPQHRVNFTSGGGTKYPAGKVVNLPRVIGHRDVGQTACPGLIYNNLGSIRNRAAQWYQLMEAIATPRGSIDSVKVTGNRVDVVGWAVDPDVPQPARVHVVLAGRLQEVQANGYRPDVGRAYPGVGDHRGWGAGFSGLPKGRHRLCVTVINQGEGNDKLLGCQDVVVK